MRIASQSRVALAGLLAMSSYAAADVPVAPSAPEATTRVVHPQPTLAHATWTYTITVPGHSEQDRRVDSLLDTPLPAEGIPHDGKSLDDLAALLRDRLGIPVTLDMRSLDGFDGTSPIFSGSAIGGTYRQMLRAVLRSQGLAYRIEDGGIRIMTAETAERRVFTVLYPLPTACNPIDLHALIERVVQPTTWDAMGGPGSISFAVQANSLAVSQTQDVHEELGDLLRKGFDQDLGPPSAIGQEGKKPRAVRAHAVPDAAVRRELEATLVDLCNAHLGPDADPSATVRVVSDTLLVESSSRPFQVHAAEMIRAIVGIELPTSPDGAVGGFGY